MSRIVLWLVFWPMLTFADDEACWSGELAEFWSVGSARDVDGRLLYCEFHRGEVSAKENSVIYRAPDGEIIAEKNISWDVSRTRPEFIQQDLRSGERIGVQQGARWLLDYRENKNSPVEQVNLSLDEIDVVDAGFDQKVRDHWDELMGGNRLRIVFAAPALQRAVPLRVTRRDVEFCPHAAASDGWRCLWVEADNALVRLFVDPLRLTYDGQRRLRVFDGVVNIRDGQGKKQKAVILYRYAGEWQSTSGK